MSDDSPSLHFRISAACTQRGHHFHDATLAKGGIPRIVATGIWGRDEAETLRKLHEQNQPIHPVRGRVEKIFGAWKRCQVCVECDGKVSPWPPTNQAHTTAITYNLKPPRR